ncbi:hypothetical protein H8356DRAFT_1725093, partial [Neocallimastix lanati (nom. inval.)]
SLRRYAHSECDNIIYIKILQILMSLINTNVLLIVQRVKEIFVKYGFKLLNEYY